MIITMHNHPSLTLRLKPVELYRSSKGGGGVVSIYVVFIQGVHNHKKNEHVFIQSIVSLSRKKNPSMPEAWDVMIQKRTIYYKNISSLIKCYYFMLIKQDKVQLFLL